MISYFGKNFNLYNFNSQGTYRSPFKFDFEQLKDIITAN